MNRSFFVVLLISFITSQAQNVNVTYSDKCSVRDLGMSGKDGGTLRRGDYFYCLEADYKGMQAYSASLGKIKYGLIVHKYDGNMKELSHGALQSGDKSFGPFSPKMTWFAGKMLIFYYVEAPDGNIQLLYSTVDPESLVVAPGKLLYTIPEKNRGFPKMETAMAENRIKIDLSPDSSKLLISQSGNTGEIFSCVLNPGLAVENQVISKTMSNMEEFVMSEVRIDGAGDRYFTFSYKEGEIKKNGLLVVNSERKEAFLSLRASAQGEDAGLLSLQLSKENGKAFVFGASSMEHLEEGVAVSQVDAANLSLGVPVVCDFPVDLKDRLKKMEYTQKRASIVVDKDVHYDGRLMDDGTLVLTGAPMIRQNYSTSSHSGARLLAYSGPIINVFIKGGQSRVGVIYRNQELSAASLPIGIPYGNKFICIYNDTEKAINSDDTHTNDKAKSEDGLVLAIAVLNSDGTIISKKMLAGRTGGPNFFTADVQVPSPGQYFIPVGRDKFNLVRYYSELEQWAKVTVD